MRSPLTTDHRSLITSPPTSSLITDHRSLITSSPTSSLITDHRSLITSSPPSGASSLITDHRSLITPSPSLHLWSYYGLRSQVWLYRLLRELTRYPAHLLVRTNWLSGRPVEEFPWPAERMHCFPDHPLLARAAAKLGPYLRSGNRNALNTLDVRFVRNLVSRLGARVVHIHFGWLAADVLSGAPDFGAPVVVSVYGSDVIRAATSRTRYLTDLGKLLKRGIPFVVESDFLKGVLVNMGATPDRVFVVPVGIDLAEQPDAELTRQHRLSRRDARPLRILTIGRLVDYKAPQKLPAVARILKNRGLDFEWNLVGEGPLLDEVRSGIQALGVADRFKICGGIPFAELKDLLWNSDLMVHNAIVAPDGGRECLGVSLIEAQAVGIPVVSCKVGGIPEAVADGQTGLLVEERYLDGMADAILRLAADPALRCDMALAGIHRARDHFDSEKLAAELESVYDAIPDAPGILPGL